MYVWILVGVLVYIAGISLIGKPMAKKGLELWIKNYPVGRMGGLLGFLLYPLASFNWEIGKPHSCMSMFLEFAVSCGDRNLDSEESRRYVAVSAIMWPFRIIFNLTAITVIVVLILFTSILYVFVGIVTLFDRELYRDFFQGK